ncbi:uncharacterized protein BX663DRAFT_505556 [Cokeromyces recurvatus]|uniref:uncharacterized protein n=1 Tax=Cokeromyces recurvatus TaxID=90255 RepID=UPI00221EA289|nr:uncharacterized protein BX663DRAFT_505556 [Cokeromyces recurvatus]KAI7903883.1 hypothetical protein BX663DRAFT_505556 [Cokeromyces recurvatus]
MATQINTLYNETEMDLTAWPSSYYGKTRRIDLAKFYQDILKASNIKEKKAIKKVRFSTDPPTVYEYEAEYDNMNATTKSVFFDDGWPGRARKAMNTTGFIDFKTKIEAKLGAINDPSLISELEKNHNDNTLFRGYYRHRKSPLVQKLNLRPIPNTNNTMLDTPLSCMEESPITPEDSQEIPNLSFINENNITQSSSLSFTTSSNNPKWLKSIPKIKNGCNSSLKSKKSISS